MVSQMSKGQYANALEQAGVAAEDYLAHFRPEWRGASLLKVLASMYGQEEGRTDTAVWLPGSRGDTTQAQSSIAQQTIGVLREASVLDAIIMTKEGSVVYSGRWMQKVGRQ
jgi:hypothetical protein